MNFRVIPSPLEVRVLITPGEEIFLEITAKRGQATFLYVIFIRHCVEKGDRLFLCVIMSVEEKDTGYF